MPRSSQYLNEVVPKTDQDFELVAEGAADCFTFHPWNDEQVGHGTAVRKALQIAFETIIAHCPAGPDRSVALRKLREARMDANSAITHQGRY